MSVIVTIRVEPIIGKFQLVESRIKKAAGICARKGAKTRFAIESLASDKSETITFSAPACLRRYVQNRPADP